MGWSCRCSPKVGPYYASYRTFFSDPFLRETVWNTLILALPTTLLNILLAVPIAFRVRLMRLQRLLTTILVLPVTLGTVLVAQGLLTYLGPQGWFNRACCMLTPCHRRADEAHQQLLGRLRLAGDHGLSLHLPADAVLRQRHRPGARTGGGDPGRGRGAALRPHLPAAARAGPRRHLLPVLRPGLRGLPLGGAARRAGGLDPCHLDRGLPGRLRALRRLARLRHRHGDGRRAAVVVLLALGARSLFYRGPVGGTKG